MADRTVSVRLRAITSEFQAGMASAGVSAKSLGTQLEGISGKSEQSFKKLGMGMLDVGAGEMAVAGGAAIAGAALLKFTKAGVDAYTELGAKVLDYQRVTGASAEESSKMVARAEALGVSTDNLSTAMFRMGRYIDTNSAALKAQGVEVVRDQQGHVDMAATLDKVTAAYQRSGKGMDGNVLAQQALGRGAKTLLPLLTATKEQLAEIDADAQRHHEILTQQDVDNTFQYRLAVHDLGEAWTGLERELGQAVVPTLAKLADGLTTVIEKADDAGHSVGGFLNHLGPLTTVLKVSGVVASGFVAPGLATLVYLHNLAGDSAHKQAEAEQKLADQAKRTAAALKDYDSSLDDLYSKTFSVSDSQDKFTKDLINFADQVKAAKTGGDEWAASLDGSTATGLANSSMVRGLTKDIVDTAKAAAAAGVSVEDATAQQRAGLEQVLNALGFTQAEAQQYVDVLAQIPGDIDTKLNLDTSAALKALNDLVQTGNAYKLWSIDPNVRSSLGGLQVGADGKPSIHATPSPSLSRGVTDALAGKGPANQSELKKLAEADKKGAQDEQAVNDYLRAVFDQRGEILKNTFERTGNGLKEYEGWLDEAIAREIPYTDAWVRLQQEKADAANAFTEDLKAVGEMQRGFEDNMFKAGAISTEKYLEILNERIAGERAYSNAWMQLVSERQQVLDQIKQQDQQLQDTADKALSTLNQELDQEASLRQQLTKLAADHQKAMTGIETQFNTDMAKILDDRRNQLQGWADVTQQVTISWGNSAAALTGNVRSQIQIFDDWVTALDDARQRGVSDQVISLLGLDQGPQALGQLRAFTSATSQQIADLNSAVADRQKQIDARVTSEAASASSKVAAQLKALAEQHAAAIEAETEQFLAQQRDLNTQLAQIGLDGGRSFGDAIAQGLLSSIPAIVDAAKKARDAQQKATDAKNQAPVAGGMQGVLVNPDTLIQLPSGDWITAGAGAFGGGLKVAPNGQIIVNPDTNMQVPGGGQMLAGAGASLGGLPHFASGTSSVPSTGPAIVHAGERIFSRMDNQALIAAVDSLGGQQVHHHHVMLDGREIGHFVSRTMRGTGVQRSVVGSR